jgi:tetratricopeptide (TPR) repeat protein
MLRQHKGSVAFAAAFVGLAIVTFLNATRSPALGEARLAYARGDLALCLEQALAHLGRQPWSREAALLAARSLSRLDFAAEAEPYFLRAGTLALNDLQIRAYGLARGPEPARAIPIYNQILAANPDQLTALKRLAAVELARSNRESLFALAERLEKAPGGTTMSLMLKGGAYHLAGKPLDSVARFEKVLALDPGLVELPLSHRTFWSQFADDLVALGRRERAQQVLTQALAQRSDALLTSRLGEIYLASGMLDEAQRAFERAMLLDSESYRPHLALAQIARERNQVELAIGHLGQSARLAPPDREGIRKTAEAFRALGRTADAAGVEEILSHLPPPDARRPSATSAGPWPPFAL